MKATFSGAVPNSGVDAGDANFQAGIIVPFRGTNLLVLNNGKGLRINYDSGLVKVEEITITSQALSSIAKVFSLDVSSVIARLNTIDQRFFIIRGDALVGRNKSEISAVKASTTAARIKLGVLVSKEFNVAIRQIMVFRTEDKDVKDVVVSSKDPFNPQGIIEHMNLTYRPQANINFTLSKSDPILMPALSYNSEGPDAQNATMTAAFEKMAADDPKADLTIFTVHKAFDGGLRNPVAGYTNAKSKFSVVADLPNAFTFEHEAGHFLGALDAKRKFVGFTDRNGTWSEVYPHRAGAVLMTQLELPNGRIPYDMAFDFNKGV